MYGPEMSNGLMHSQSAVQNKHMFVYNPDSGRSVVINASLVGVSYAESLIKFI